MNDVTPERLQQALYDSLRNSVGKPFDQERTAEALARAVNAVIPADYIPPNIIEMDDGDYRVELVKDESGMPAVRLTPIVYIIEITMKPDEVSRP